MRHKTPHCAVSGLVFFMVIYSSNAQVTIGFESEEQSIMEQENSVEICAEVKNSVLERTVVVDFSTSVDARERPATSGEDFVATMTTWTFDPDTSTNCVTVSLTNDVLVEGVELFSGVLSTGGKGVTLSPQRTNISILDDDRVVVSMENGSVVEVSEDIGEVRLFVSVITGELGRDVTVMVVYERRNAIDGEDYIPHRSLSLVFGPAVLDHCFNIPIIDDHRYELREDFFVNITTSDPDTDIGRSTTIIMITDEDVIVLGWDSLVYNTTRSSGTVQLCASLRGPGILAATLPIMNLITADGTAMSGEDYNRNLNPNTFEFLPGGVTRLCTVATIIDNGIIGKSPKYFEATISLIPTERVTVTPIITTVQISSDGENTTPPPARTTPPPARTTPPPARTTPPPARTTHPPARTTPPRFRGFVLGGPTNPGVTKPSSSSTFPPMTVLTTPTCDTGNSLSDANTVSSSSTGNSTAAGIQSSAVGLSTDIYNSSMALALALIQLAFNVTLLVL